MALNKHGIKTWYLVAVYAVFHFCLAQFIANYEVLYIHDLVFWCVFPFSVFSEVK